MLIKLAPLGERVVEVNVEAGTTVQRALEIADILHNGRSIAINNTPADLDTEIINEGSIITLANKMKGGM